MTTSYFSAVLFDCDGVLVDSEPITNGVLREMLNESGWPITQAECGHIFIGKAVRDERLLIEEKTQQPLTEDWMRTFYQRRDQRLRAHLQPMPGALAAVQAAHHRFQGRVACASGADRGKVQMQLGMANMSPYLSAHVYSGQELPANKPAPDVYLAAAAGLGVAAQHCLVIEDTATGAHAGLAAGATVWGLDITGQSTVFDGLAVQRIFNSMELIAQAIHDLPYEENAAPA